MREIKFRAWDKSENQMARFVSELLFNNKGLYGIKLNHMGFEFKRRLRDVILMQYTGLKDGNDKEVYEGDILEFIWGEVGTVRGCVVCEEGRFLVRNDIQVVYLRTSIVIDKAKVIGNIYENPELLGNEEGI